MTIIIESVTLPERGPLNLHVDVAAIINISAKEAQRKVSVFLGNTIADLLVGEMPSLVWQHNMTVWRVPVLLSSRSMGRIGIVGTIDVNVYNGDLHITDQIIEEIEENAQRFAAGAAL